MIASRIYRIGAAINFDGVLPFDINRLRVDSKITADAEKDSFFKQRVQTAMLYIEAEAGIKLFNGTFVARWEDRKIGNHGNRYRPLTLPALDPEVKPMAGSQSTIDTANLQSGFDYSGNLEIYPNKYWQINTDIVLEFTAGFSADGINSNPYLQQLIATHCRYTYYQDQADQDLLNFQISKVTYASRDST